MDLATVGCLLQLGIGDAGEDIQQQCVIYDQITGGGSVAGQVRLVRDNRCDRSRIGAGGDGCAHRLAFVVGQPGTEAARQRGSGTAFLGDRPAGLFHRVAQVRREIDEIHGHPLIVRADPMGRSRFTGFRSHTTCDPLPRGISTGPHAGLRRSDPTNRSLKRAYRTG